MKALELLKLYQYADNCLDGLMAEKLNEAITELEELKNRNCDGCIHKNSEGVMEYSCFECSRYYSDRFDAEV